MKFFAIAQTESPSDYNQQCSVELVRGQCPRHAAWIWLEDPKHPYSWDYACTHHFLEYLNDMTSQTPAVVSITVEQAE